MTQKTISSPSYAATWLVFLQQFPYKKHSWSACIVLPLEISHSLSPSVECHNPSNAKSLHQNTKNDPIKTRLSRTSAKTPPGLDGWRALWRFFFVFITLMVVLRNIECRQCLSLRTLGILFYLFAHKTLFPRVVHQQLEEGNRIGCFSLFCIRKTDGLIISSVRLFLMRNQQGGGAKHPKCRRKKRSPVQNIRTFRVDKTTKQATLDRADSISVQSAGNGTEIRGRSWTHRHTHTHTANDAIFRVFRRRRHRRRPKSVLSWDNFLAALSSKLTKASGGENLPSSLSSNGLLIAL